MHAIKIVVAKGRDRLIQEYPVLLQSSNRVTQYQADTLGVSVEELQEVALLKSLDAIAHRNGQELVDLLIRHGADSDEQANELLDRRRALIDRRTRVDAPQG